MMSIKKNLSTSIGLTALLLLAAFFFTGQAVAATFDAGIPAGWTGTGNFGALGANGDVTLAPGGGTQYGYVSSYLGVTNAGLGLGGETNGSTLNSSLFSAAAGDEINFNFNYVTSDGAGFADYAWASLLDSSSNTVAVLFTARTTPAGNSVPGFGMPAISATVDPATVVITPGAPIWAPLGPSSGTCFAEGCGYSGWVASSYTIASAGNYSLQFGVVNWADQIYDSGLAFDGLTVGGVPIEEVPPDQVPEPSTMMLLGSGLVGLAFWGRNNFRK